MMLSRRASRHALARVAGDLRFGSVGGEAQQEPARADLLKLREVAAFVRRHAPLVGGALSAGIGGAVLYLLITTTTFTARAQLLIDPKSSQITRDEAREQSAIDSAQVESQLAILRSDRIAALVIRDLDLFNSPQLARALKGATSESDRMQRAIAALAPGLDVRRSGLSYVIDVSYTSPDRDFSARVANATAEAYIRDQRDARTDSAKVGSEWLERRAAYLRNQMNKAALALQEFKVGRDYRVFRDGRAGEPAESGGATRDASGGNAARAASLAKDRNTLEELETTAQSYQKIYESALQGYAEAVQRTSNPLSDTRVLTKATPPLSKSHPRTTLILAFGMLAGGLAGVGASLVRENLDRSQRSVYQAKAQLGVICLGVLPLIRRASPLGRLMGRSLRRRLLLLWAALRQRHLKPSLACFSPAEAVGRDPFLNALANVTTTLAATERGRSLRTIGITSAHTGEGKSTIAGNLACLLSASGLRVLIIDADLRRAALTRAASADARTGLVQVLLGHSPLRESFVRVPRTGVALLPNVGVSLATFDTLLGSKAMADCLRDALTTYEIIVVDLPALDQSAGAMAMGPLLDGVLLAVEWGTTQADAAIDAIERLESSGSDVLGTVLNKAR